MYEVHLYNGTLPFAERDVVFLRFASRVKAINEINRWNTFHMNNHIYLHGPYWKEI